MTRTPAAIVLVAGVAAASAALASADRKFGKTLIATYTVPREALDRFNTLPPRADNPKLSPLENMLERKTQGWQADKPLQVSAKANPYRVAIRYEGEVIGDQGVVTLWTAGWFREGTMQTAEGTVATPLAGLNVPAAEGRRGARVTRAGAAGPLSFRYDGQAFPSIEINRLEGLRLDRVEVEVWSGIAGPDWKEIVLGWQGALTGATMLGLWFLFHRRRSA